MPRQIKLACCNELFEDWSLEDAFTTIKTIGYDGVEITPYTISQYVTDIPSRDRGKVKLIAQALELEVVGIHWVTARTEGLHVIQPDRGVKRRTAAYLVELVKFCHDIGGRIIVFGSPDQRRRLANVDYELQFQSAKETFREAAKVATDLGVTICIEPLARSISDFINRAEEAVRIASEIGEPSMKIILDCYSMGDEDKSREQLIRENAAWLAHVHANDVNKQGPGMAENGVNFTEVFRALLEVDYTGYVSVESFDFTPGAETTARRSYAHLINCYQRALDDLTDATAVFK